jgi:hypothetical protein
VVEIFERLVYLVNSGASEIEVTILVRGRVISGFLTPNQRFQTWMLRTINQAAQQDSDVQVPLVDDSRMLEEEKEAVRQAWRSLEQGAFDSPSSDAVRNLRHSHQNFCLRNARIWGSFRGLSEMARVAYLMLAIDAVEGFSLGQLRTSNESQHKE